jgi:hypothetical protein
MAPATFDLALAAQLVELTWATAGLLAVCIAPLAFAAGGWYADWRAD